MIKNLCTWALLCMSIISYSQDKLKVVASTTIFADMAKSIGGDQVEVESIVSVGADPHTYESIPSDAQLVKSADVIFKNGLTLEGWIDKIITNGGSKAEVKTITEGITPIASTEYKNAYDPHAWMVAENGLTYIKNIYETLSKVDPKNQEYYLKNYESYSNELKSLEQYIKEQIATIPVEKRLLVTSHDAFNYYGRKYGLKLSAINGISTEAEIQTSDIIRVKKDIKESGIPAIFVESTINPKVIQQIAYDNGVSIGGELYSDSLGDPGSDGDTYTKMLRHNTNVIVKALSKDIMSETKIDGDNKGKNFWIYLALGAAMILGLIFMITKLNK